MDIILFIIFLLIFLSFMSVGILWGVPWLPTRKKEYDRITELVNLKPNMYFYDLGSGSAEMLFYLSKRYNVKYVGIEVSPILYLYSKIKSLFYKNVQIKYGSFFQYNLSKADIIYVFLLPRIYGKLRNKLNTGLKKNVKVILSTWPFKDLNAAIISKKNNEATYYLYKKNSLIGFNKRV